MGNPSARYQAELEAQQEKEKLHKELFEDPFIGYKTFDEALEDYKFTSQAEVVARLLNRENIAISGPAGSGKTTTINRFIDLIREEYNGVFEVAVTASTGIAATLIGGQTLHSWAGLGISTEPFDPKKLDRGFHARKNAMKYTDVLIIDEVSMLPAYLFEKLDATLKYVRRNKKPFGGVQLVLIGDFLQLPPVRKSDTDDSINTDFIITTQVWKDADIKYCFLDKTHRASDKRLKYVLNRIAANKVDDHTRNFVNSRLSIEKDPNKTYTTLYTTNANVDKFNQDRLAENPNPLRLFKANEQGSAKDIEKIYKSYGIEKVLEFKIGATVMLTANMTDEVTSNFYANGSIGKIEGWLGDDVRVRFNDGNIVSVSRREYNEEKKVNIVTPEGQRKAVTQVVATVLQVPLKLGYAITVHKSQGQTFDGVVVDLQKCFTPGLGYVALSRVRTLDDLIVVGMSEKAYLINERSLKISRFVKKRALMAREELLANKKHYEELLTSKEARSKKWDPAKSGGAKLLAGL